jgi:hypothetical protein
MKAVKNYTSDIPMNRLFDKLNKTLIEHQAKSITFGYNPAGKCVSVEFAIELADGKRLQIKLPARIDQAAEILKQQYNQGLIRDRKVLDPDQAYRVAWRNILDWTEAQMAMVDIQMVKMQEVFLPYLTNKQGLTMYELMEIGGYNMPKIEANNG